MHPVNFKTGALLAMSFAALASLPAAAQSVATVRDIDAIQADTLKTLALSANADAKAALKAKGGVSGGDSNDALPFFKGIKLFGDTLYAELLYGDGQTKYGKVGDKVPGCLTVTKVSTNQVDVTDCEHRSHTLAMSGTPPTNPTRDSTTQTNGMPMVFPAPSRPIGH